MAKIIFTEEDERLIESLLEEFDPAKHPVASMLPKLLAEDEWARLSDGLRSFIESKIRTCMAARAYILALKEAGALDEVEPREYLHNDIWSPNFGFGSEVPEEFASREDLPYGPSREWRLPGEYVISVSEIIEERFQSGLDFQPVS